MPIYAYQCVPEEHQFEAYVASHQTPSPECKICGGPVEKIWKITRHIGGVNWPFTTSHLTGKPETFANQADLDRRCKELGIAQRDDAAWVEQEYEGYDWVSGKQKYREGSGVGLPGCWV